jgi:hypothetical protein
MANFHHRPIHRFGLDGEIYDESAIGRFKLEYTKTLQTQIRIDGYVPRLDIDPDFTIQYNSEREIFEFTLSVYGVYVGKSNSECILGIDGQGPIYIQSSKSPELSQGQA